MKVSVNDYLNQCNNEWKGKNIRELPIKYLANIKPWIISKCEEENLDFNNYDIYKNIVKEIQKKEDEKLFLIYDKHNVAGYGTHYYEDKEGNYIETVK